MREELDQLEAEMAKLDVGAEEDIAEYRALKMRLARAEAAVRRAVVRPDRALAFLRPGRLVRVTEGLNVRECVCFGVVLLLLMCGVLLLCLDLT